MKKTSEPEKCPNEPEKKSGEREKSTKEKEEKNNKEAEEEERSDNEKKESDKEDNEKISAVSVHPLNTFDGRDLRINEPIEFKIFKKRYIRYGWKRVIQFE